MVEQSIALPAFVRKRVPGSGWSAGSSAERCKRYSSSSTTGFLREKGRDLVPGLVSAAPKDKSATPASLHQLFLLLEPFWFSPCRKLLDRFTEQVAVGPPEILHSRRFLWRQGRMTSHSIISSSAPGNAVACWESGPTHLRDSESDLKK